MKRTIRLTESDLHRVIKESVKRILRESGDSDRGQYMMGRALRRASDRGDYDTVNNIYDRINPGDGPAKKGFDDQRDGKNPHQVKWNYDVYKMQDMEKLGRNFINFIEKYQGGSLLQTVVDYETGNQTGEKASPLGELIPYFEEEVLGYKCTPDMIEAITNAYYQWWNYAEGVLCDGY